MVHNTIENNSGCFCSAKIILIMSMKVGHSSKFACFHCGHLLHKSWSFGQEYKAWITSSPWFLQQAHVSSSTILLRTRLDIVGSESLHALHTKFFTFDGTFNLQICCHKGFITSKFEGLGCWFWNSFCRNLYPDFTVYSLLGLCGHVRVSCCYVLGKGMAFTLAASKSIK